MSDGPHKSLPKRRHWINLAERAATPAYSPREVAEAGVIAVKTEMREAPLEEVRRIFLGGPQGSLFKEDCYSQLEEARKACRGSAAGTALIDCAQEAHANGLTGEDAYEAAVRNACDAVMRNESYCIEEHYRREDVSSVDDVRARLAAARHELSSGELADALSPDAHTGGGDLRLTKKTGVDEGPPL